MWGPPGTGKTTIARIIANTLNRPFYTLNAVSAGVKEVREVIEKAKSSPLFARGSAILFIDEIHRFSKSQQDSLLSAVETGVVTLIGATTENPSFEVIRPLLSRCQLYVLKSLEQDDLMQLLGYAIANDHILKERGVELRETAAMMRYSGGDARKLLNILELVVESDPDSPVVITDEKVKQCFPHVDAGTFLANNIDPDRMFSTECLFGYYNKNRGLIYEDRFNGETAGKSLLAPRAGYINSLLFANETQDYRYMSQYTNGLTLEGESTMYMIKHKEIKDQNRDDVVSDTNDDEAFLQASKFHGTFCSLMKVSEAYYILAEALGTPTSDIYNSADAWSYLSYIRQQRGASTTTGNDAAFTDLLTKEYIREFTGEGQVFFYFKRNNKGFDNDYNGKKEIKILIQEAFLWFPAEYSYKDEAKDEEKERRFVAPLPASELDNR
jgi:SpoVK/Ycf46/Vps4 family AAA+-type ATPase